MRNNIGVVKYEARLEYKEETVKNAIGSIHYCKCIKCKKRWVNERMVRNCKIWAEVMKERYSSPED